MLGTLEFLFAALMPVSVVGACAGLALVLVSLVERRGPVGLASFDRAATRSSAIEPFVVAILGLLPVIVIVTILAGIARGSRGPMRMTGTDSLIVFLIVIAACLVAAPAFLWRTRFRLIAEGVATVALSALALVGAWSIGILFLPLVAAMIWVCGFHLWRSMNRRLERPAIRVDSSP
jgi:hypothetical protein